MPLFRKRPVVIEATQWLPAEGNREMPIPPAPHSILRQSRTGWQIQTLEGWLSLSPGDWIIRGGKGEIYACKPDIFAATYEAVTEQTLTVDRSCSRGQYPLGALVVGGVVCPIVATQDSATNCHVELSPEPVLPEGT